MISRWPLADLIERTEPVDLTQPLIITEVRTMDDLSALAQVLGEPVIPGVGMTSATLESEAVYEVRVRNSGHGESDVYGHAIYSTLADAFPLHTDGYNLEVPPDVVLLQRVDDSREDPAMFVATSAVIGQLHEADRTELEQAQFPSAIGPIPLVGSDGSLRLNIGEIKRWGVRSGVPLRPEAARALRALEVRLQSIAIELRLQQSECLALDNRRCAHGRAALDPSSTRVLNRMWLAKVGSGP